MESSARKVLSVRQAHQSADKTLAELYDPNKMPADLLAAHSALDKAVDASYGLKRGFASEAKRVAWLFERYGEMVRK
ncbi:MAG: type IIL restriction-modification enzyme MmeI [Bacteroidota bacterium]